jgi:hypothetical protein
MIFSLKIKLNRNWKFLEELGCAKTFGLFCYVKVLECWMIFSLEIKLNHKWKFQRNGDVPWHLDLLCKNLRQKKNPLVPLVSLVRSWGVGFIGIYFARFGLRIEEILNFMWFFSLKIQINHKRPSFERKNQLRMWSHLKVYHSIQVWGIGL